MHDDHEKHIEELMSEWFHSMQRTINEIDKSELPPYMNDTDLEDAAVKAFYQTLVKHKDDHSSGMTFGNFLKDRIKKNVLSLTANKATKEKVDLTTWNKLKREHQEVMDAKANQAATADDSMDAPTPDLPPQMPAEVKTFGPDSPEVQEANIKLKQQQTPKE
jgi:hypothetical protein